VEQNTSCCAPSLISLDQIETVNWNGGYSPADKAGIPAEAADFSLGCGNPLAMAGLAAGETVLDIGSGGGLDAFIAARRVGPTGQVIGVDMTPAMLDRARKAAEKGGYTNIDFRQGYAEKMPVADGVVDVIISNCVINLTEDKSKVFAEACRVLKPGGRLEVNDVVFGGPILPAERASASSWAECISGALPEQEYLDLVKQAGFKNVTARRSTSAGISSGVSVYSVQVSAVKQG
jgi:SAM-dependent methyltransferase